MTLKEQINADFITAFKAKDLDKKNFLGILKGEIQLAESKEGYDGEKTNLSIVKKMAKSLKTTGDADSLRELTYIEGYLPSLMSEEQIRTVVQQIIVDTGGANMGQIMGAFTKEHKGKADNSLVSKIVREELA